MKRNRIALCSTLLALALLAGCSDLNARGTLSVESATPAPGESAQTPAGILSSFTATDLAGNEVTQEIFAEHELTMVNIWATFCRPCLVEMPDLGEISAEYADKGVQIVGLVSDTLTRDGEISSRHVELAQEVIDTTGADYLHLLPSQDLFNLLSQATSVPTTFFVDQNGDQVGYTHVGAKSKDAWVKLIDETLAEVRE